MHRRSFAMPVITALEPQKKNQQRINVFLDGAYGFAVSMDAAVTLHQGQELGDAEIAALQAQDERERAYQSALRYLGSRPRSQAEVERHLGNKGFAAAGVAAAIQRLTEQQYLNDEEFARLLAGQSARVFGRAVRRWAMNCASGGWSKETIAAALTDLDETAAAWAAVAPKLARWQSLPQSDLEPQGRGLSCPPRFRLRRDPHGQPALAMDGQLQDEGDE